MRILTLIIKQNWFDKIMSGEKKEEYREITPRTQKKYVEVDNEGFAKEDANGNCIPKKYDAIRFYVGYNKDRDSALIKVKDAKVDYICDEDTREPIAYELDEKDKNGEPVYWVAAQITFMLGDVIEKQWQHGQAKK